MIDLDGEGALPFRGLRLAGLVCLRARSAGAQEEEGACQHQDDCDSALESSEGKEWSNVHVVPLIVLSNWHGAPEPGTRCSIGPAGRKELISLVACVKWHTAKTMRKRGLGPIGLSWPSVEPSSKALALRILSDIKVRQTQNFDCSRSLRTSSFTMPSLAAEGLCSFLYLSLFSVFSLAPATRK